MGPSWPDRSLPALIATTTIEATFASTALLYGLAVLPLAAIPRDPVPDYRDDVLLFLLDRDAFLSGIGAHRRSAEVAERTVAARMQRH
jgi:hypothetical protein